MIPLAITFAVLIGYLWVGFAHVAPSYVAREMEAFARRCPTLVNDRQYVADRRRSTCGEAVFIAVVWLPYLAGRAATGAIARRAPFTDHELREQNRQQANRIAELERELGIDP